MAGTPQNVTLISAVSSFVGSEQSLSLNWRIENLERFVKLSENVYVFARLPFEMRGPSRILESCDKLAFEWNLGTNKCSGQNLYIALQYLKSSNVLKGKTLNEYQNLYIDCSIDIKLKDDLLLRQSLPATRLQSASQTYCPLILTSDRLNKYVDADGSMTFQLGVKIYLVNGKEAKTVVTEGCALNDLSTPRIMNFALEDKNDLEQLDYQLGDVKTSNVNISVINDSEKEVRVFYCHSRVLSDKSPVFREMFEKDGQQEEVELKIDNVSADVVDQFLTFMYTGSLKEKRPEDGSNDLTWIELLPQLVCIARKYNVKDLVSFCDTNLHRAVNSENVVEILKVAKRHGLGTTLAKLREAKYMDMLFESDAEDERI